MLEALITTVLLFAGIGPARPALPRTGRPPVVQRFNGSGSSTISLLVATPSTISFHATNPDGGAVPGNSAATVTWTGNASSAAGWTLSVQSGSTTFNGCPTVPVSAVTVTCGSASVSGGGVGSCSAAFPLSTSPAQVAGGTETMGAASYSVTLSFALAESWRYIATQSSCTLTLTYTVDLQ